MFAELTQRPEYLGCLDKLSPHRSVAKSVPAPDALPYPLCVSQRAFCAGRLWFVTDNPLAARSAIRGGRRGNGGLWSIRQLHVGRVDLTGEIRVARDRASELAVAITGKGALDVCEWQRSDEVEYRVNL